MKDALEGMKERDKSRSSSIDKVELKNKEEEESVSKTNDS